MAWKVTTVVMAADTTATHTTAGEYGTMLIQCADTGTTVKGSLDGTNGTADLMGGTAADTPISIDNYPYLLLDSDGSGDAAIVIAERVKDPS